MESSSSMEESKSNAVAFVFILKWFVSAFYFIFRE